jgi:hypothetical protein
MKVRSGRFSILASVVAFLAVLMSASAVFAQSSDSGEAAGAAMAAGFIGIILVFVLVVYLYMALSLQTIANKTGAENAWLAWIPIANIFLLLNIAKKPAWWFLLCLIPIVSIVIAVMIWMEVAKARNKPDWWGILIIVPLVGIIVPGYLAWAD